MITEQDVENALDYLRDNATKIAKARAERIYIEHFRRSKKAMLVSQSPEDKVAGKEAWAYRHPEYLELLTALKIAVDENKDFVIGYRKIFLGHITSGFVYNLSFRISRVNV